MFPELARTNSSGLDGVGRCLVGVRWLKLEGDQHAS